MNSGELIKKLTKLYTYFSNSKIQYRILIDGKWGIGKTFTYNSFIKSKNSNHYYISLFGISSLEEIEKKIVQQVLFPTFKKLNKNKIANIITELGTQYLENKSGLNFSDIIKINKIENLQFSEKALICFDDIERINENISFKELLGLIERLGNKTNIIILCNKEKLSEENLEIFNEYQEKIIDYYFYLDEIDNGFIEKLILKWGFSSESKDFLVEFFNENGEQNIRYLEKIKTTYQEVSIEYGKNKWFIENEKILVKVISFLMLEQFYGKLTMKYKQEQKRFMKSLGPSAFEKELDQKIENEIKPDNYMEAIPFDIKEIAIILNKFIKSNLDIEIELVTYFKNQKIFETLSKKIHYWFLEDEESIKNQYDDFKRIFIENLDVFNIHYKLRGYIVLKRFEEVLSKKNDLLSLENKLKDSIKKELDQGKSIDIHWEVQHYLIREDELENIYRIKKDAENEFNNGQIEKIKKLVSNLEFKNILKNNKKQFEIEDMDELKDFLDVLIYKRCPREYWDNLEIVLELLSLEARKQLLKKIDKNIENEKNIIIKSRNEFIKNRIIKL